MEPIAALAEIIAMGGLVGKAAADRAMNLDSVPEFDNAVRQERVRLDTMIGEQGPHPRMLIQELKETMWSNAGIIRNQQSLDRAMETIMIQEDNKALVTTPGSLIRFLEFRNMRLVAELVCRSALERTESRGSHFRSDYPGENDQGWLKNIQAKKAVFGVTLEQFPVPGGDSVLS
jgi:succinate dehydrogenase/fumarate reductase flavoprotein subunit